MKTFTFSDCYTLLDVDPKTFRRWLDKAGINPEQQISKVDSRIRYLTENQIEDLALAHGRPWPPEPKTDDQTQAGPGSMKLLTARVDELAAQIAGAYERIRQLEAFREAMQHQIEDQAILIDEQSTQINDQAAQIETLRTAQQERPAKRSREEQPAESAAGMPSDLVAWRAFTDLHKMPQTTTGRYIKQGFIHIIQGKWKVGNGYVKEALDAKGRHDFWVQFHSSTGFTTCDDCPHDIPQQS